MVPNDEFKPFTESMSRGEFLYQVGLRIGKIKADIKLNALSSCSCPKEDPNDRLTPSEKWERLKHPTCASDYGISMTMDEIKQVPGAREEIASWYPIEQ